MTHRSRLSTNRSMVMRGWCAAAATGWNALTTTPLMMSPMTSKKSSSVADGASVTTRSSPRWITAIAAPGMIVAQAGGSSASTMEVDQ